MALRKSVEIQKTHEIHNIDEGRKDEDSMESILEALKGEVSKLRAEVSALKAQVSQSANRYVATCPSCSTQYDMLANHYSIGLFDNMVYVKCPRCNKAIPVYGGIGGEIGTTSDESP